MEDNPSDVFLLRRALDQNGVTYSLEVIQDGERAIELLKRIGSNSAIVPDLIILDLNLPRHDGIEILAACRKTPGIEQLPVMVLTSSDSPRERELVERLGVTDFARKPILLDDFMALGGRVKRVIEGSAP